MPQDGYYGDKSFPHDGKQGRCGCGEGYSWDDNDGKFKRICNGEQVAGFKNIHTGKIEEVMLIKNQADLDAFKKMYGIDGEIEKEY